MPSATLSLELPSEEAELLRTYAGRHGITVSELVGLFAKGLGTVGNSDIHPEVRALAGLVPSDWNVQAEYRQRQVDKHR